MSKYGKNSEPNKQSQIYFRGKGVSRSEQKEINRMLGRGILGILAFAFVSSFFVSPKQPITYLTSEEIRASQVQSEKATYQNQINQSVNNCDSATTALSQHEQTGSIGISSDEYVNRQVELIRLKDVYCR